MRTRTNIVLDDALVAEAMKLAHAKSKRELVDHVLRDFVARSKRKDLRELVGKVRLRDDYDHKALREGRSR